MTTVMLMTEIAGLWLAVGLVTGPLAGRWLRERSTALGHVCRFDGPGSRCRECGRAGFVEERLGQSGPSGAGQPERSGGLR